MANRLQLNMMSLGFGVRRIWVFLVGLLCLVVFNEVLIYLVVLLQCTWPQLQTHSADFTIQASQNEPLRALLLADTHLLGSKEGHWLDKLRREWQMERSFQTSMLIHSPDIVFVIGDLFDEGKWSSDAEFHSTVERFNTMFATPSHTEMQVVVGNHDIGFHYMADLHKSRRFEKAMSTPSVRMLHVKGNTFVLINSIAMEGDSCSLCSEAEEQLSRVSQSLQCAMGKFARGHCSADDSYTYSRPILIQHFPMYRASDANCTGPDSNVGQEKYQKFRERWDCISKSASKMLFTKLNPRLIFSAHTHHGCFLQHKPDGIPEWTIASFNWRNRNNPVFLLATISSNNFAVEKCFLPQESTVIYIYIAGLILLLLYLLFPRKLIFSSKPRKHL